MAKKTVKESTRSKLQNALLTWFKLNGRNLPWRGSTDPYAILVSEIMLQQTQVARVIPSYNRFLNSFPNIYRLAEAPLNDVVRSWAGLGYYKRAIAIREIAKRVTKDYSGSVPADPEALITFPGIGRYTANAVACFAFQQDLVILDTNIRRVVGRLCHGDTQVNVQLLESAARDLLPLGNGPDWNQALMDLGATVCHPLSPRCHECPIEQFCTASDSFRRRTTAPNNKPTKSASSNKKFEGSRRYYRGRIIDYLSHLDHGQQTGLDRLGQAIKDGYSQDDIEWINATLRGLEKDGLVQIQSWRDPMNPKENIILVSLPTD